MSVSFPETRSAVILPRRGPIVTAIEDGTLQSQPGRAPELPGAGADGARARLVRHSVEADIDLRAPISRIWPRTKIRTVSALQSQRSRQLFQLIAVRARAARPSARKVALRKNVADTSPNPSDLGLMAGFGPQGRHQRHRMLAEWRSR